jgi:hypothetical protein
MEQIYEKRRPKTLLYCPFKEVHERESSNYRTKNVFPKLNVMTEHKVLLYGSN